MEHREWATDDYLSLGGVYANEENRPSVPISLQAYLDRNPNTEVIIFHLDNDEIGRRATSQIFRGLRGKYDLLDNPPNRGKDFNDYLKMEKERREISR